MKILLHTLFFFLLVQQICLGQGTWTKIGDMPEIRYAHTADEINGKVYITGGVNTEQGAYPTTMLVYDKATSTWSTIPLPGNSLRGQHTSCVVDSNLYIIGGGILLGGTVNSTTQMYIFKPSTGEWIAKNPMPTDRQTLGCALLDGKIYVAGGLHVINGVANYNGLKTFEVYDLSTETWSALPDMPTNRWGLSVVSFDGKIYVFGGRTLDFRPASVDVYNPQNNTWTSITNIPTPRYQLATCVLNNNIFAIDGWYSSGYGPIYDKVEVYKPLTNQWRTETPMPIAVAMLDGYSLDGKIYMYGGSYTTHPNFGISDIWEFTPSLNFAHWDQQNSGTIQNLRAVNFADANNGWAVGDSGTILHTTDAGSTWMQQTSSTNYSINAVLFIDNDIGWVVGDDGIILKTTNGGASWSNQSSGTTNSLRSVHFVNSSNGWVVGYNGTIIKTTNGGNSWTIELSGMYYEQLRSIFFSDNNIGWIAGGYQYGFPTYVVETKLWKTTDAGGNWIQKINNGNTILSGVTFFDNNWGAAIGGDYRAGSDMLKLSENLDGLESLEMNDGPGKILITNDGGENWTVSFEDLTLTYAFNDACFVTQNTIVVVGSTISELIPKQLIFISTNRGINWVSYTKDNGNDWADLIGICFVDSLNGWVVGDGGTILHTTNGGVPVELIYFTATISGNEVFLNWSTSTETNNSGFSIERKSGNSEFTEIGFVPGFGTTTEPKSYSYTNSKVSAGKYTYRLKQIDFDGSYEYSQEVEVEVSAPFEFALEQNFPNPFNPNTKINWQSPVGSHQTIKVFDVLGNEIATLVDEYKPAGTYEVEFNAAALPSGVYFYQLKVDNYYETKKMILIK